MSVTVTLTDVAERAGVHLSTASRVLNGAGRVGPETRQRILQAAADLDFVPNAQARFLAQGTSRTVGMITQFAQGNLSLPVFVGASREFGGAEMAVLHYDADGDEAALGPINRRIRSRQIEGMLIVGDGPEHPIESLTTDLAIPAVYAFATSENPADSCFTTDGLGAGRLAAEHLLGIGRRSFAHITAEHSQSARDRWQGFSQAIERSDVAAEVRPPLYGDWSREWGSEAARRLLPDIGLIDAIFCGNDDIALGVETVLLGAGFRVPGDVALIGFDNLEGTDERIAATRAAGRHLTTIDPHLSELGAAAARSLIDTVLLGSAPTEGLKFQSASLLVGETTAR